MKACIHQALLLLLGVLCTSLATAGDISNAKTDQDKYRIIDGTQSPSGQFALGLGLAQKDIDWNALYNAQMGDYGADPDDQTTQIVNYIVDTKTGRVLGETGGQYFGTLDHYNDDSCDVCWSPDSYVLVQVIHRKWFSLAKASRIDPKSNLAASLDLEAKADFYARSFLAVHKRDAYEKYKNRFAITIETKHWGGNSGMTVGNDGVIKFQIDVEVPKLMEDDSYFELTEKLQLTKDMRLLAIDFAPVQQ